MIQITSSWAGDTWQKYQKIFLKTKFYFALKRSKMRFFEKRFFFKGSTLVSSFEISLRKKQQWKLPPLPASWRGPVISSLSHQEKVKRRFTLGLSLLIPYPPPGWGGPSEIWWLKRFWGDFWRPKGEKVRRRRIFLRYSEPWKAQNSSSKYNSERKKDSEISKIFSLRRAVPLWLLSWRSGQIGRIWYFSSLLIPYPPGGWGGPSEI